MLIDCADEERTAYQGGQVLDRAPMHSEARLEGESLDFRRKTSRARQILYKKCLSIPGTYLIIKFELNH